jgi:hypothetical protein
LYLFVTTSQESTSTQRIRIDPVTTRSTSRRSLSTGGAGEYSLVMEQDAPMKPMLMRELVGEALRQERVTQGRTLREVSKAARVSLGYLSEVERGQKEASSELLAAICRALDLPLSVVLTIVAEKLALAERLASVPTIRPIARAAA